MSGRWPVKSLKETSNHNQPSKIKLDPLKLEHKSQKISMSPG